MSKLIAVADTTPLYYLILIGQAELLAKLYGQVLVPPAVVAELSAPNTPDAIRQWLANRPHWLETREVHQTMAFPSGLHVGEREAIQLATSVGADLILMDDSAARKHAVGLGLQVVRTLALLEGAYQKEILDDLRGSLAALRATNFYISDSLLNRVLERNPIKRPTN